MVLVLLACSGGPAMGPEPCRRQERCNGVDDNCDGVVDEAGAVGELDWYADEDGDGYGAGEAVAGCEAPPGRVGRAGDCDDTDGSVSPAAAESCDGTDENCDGVVDEAGAVGELDWYADEDGDGYGAGEAVARCEAPLDFVDNNLDCDDTAWKANPDAAEECNHRDDNCDGMVDEAGAVGEPDWYADHDGDGYGYGEAVPGCGAPDGFVRNVMDCDDTDTTVNPGADERCDVADVDEDCDGLADDDDDGTVDALLLFTDDDGDGYGGLPVRRCEWAPGLVDNGADCDDTSAENGPGGVEVCDGMDNDCDGRTDVEAIDGIEVMADLDGDGFGAATGTMIGCSDVGNTLDCDDTNRHDPMVVDDNAGKVQEGSLWAPLDNIQDAIDASPTCVFVLPGTYAGAIDFDGHDVRVVSTGGATETIIEAGSTFGFRIDSGEVAAELDGFTIVGGIGASTAETTSGSCGSATVCRIEVRRYRGAGVMVDGANATLKNLVIQDGAAPGYNHEMLDTVMERYTYSYGGGIYVGNGTVTISNVDVSANEALYGGGLCIGDNADVEVADSRFAFNNSLANTTWTTNGGGGVAVLGASTTASFENVRVVGNTSGGGVYVEDAAATFRNSTLVGNEAPADGGSAFTVLGLGGLTLESSVVWEATPGVFIDAGAAFAGSYNDVSGYDGVTDPTGTDGNLSADPLFLAWTDDGVDNDDLHLQSGSPAIDAGNPDRAWNDVDGTRNDQGAYGGPGAE